jgi:A/G-specific adenine glycosylase
VIARAVAGAAQPGSASPRDLTTMGALLPEGDADAAVFNAAMMELGATVCTARAPSCEACPIADRCAWRSAGYPETPDVRRRQARYEGSDRQARGAVLRILRETAEHAVLLDEVLADWPDAAQRDRAIDSLIHDGLAEASGGMLSLPR